MSDPREPQQRCGTCRWRAARFVWRDPDMHRCEAPLPQLPDSIVHAIRGDRRTMSPDDGTTCPTWELREEESRYAK